MPLIDRALVGEVISIDVQVPFRAGGTRDVHIDYLPERGDNGEVLGCYTLVQDITERKGAELRLRESEARFKSLADRRARDGLGDGGRRAVQLPIAVLV